MQTGNGKQTACQQTSQKPDRSYCIADPQSTCSLIRCNRFLLSRIPACHGLLPFTAEPIRCNNLLSIRSVIFRNILFLTSALASYLIFSPGITPLLIRNRFLCSRQQYDILLLTGHRAVFIRLFRIPPGRLFHPAGYADRTVKHIHRQKKP